MKPERIHPPFVWYGGKGMLLKKLLPLIPEGGQPYAEPFCGAANVFFAREPAPIEVLNDIDQNIVNLFRVLQDKESFEKLRHWVAYTPYSRDELRRALQYHKQQIDDPITKAWSFLVRVNQGMCGKPAKTETDWGRTIKPGKKQTCTWLMRIHMLDAICWRLQRAQIDNVDAIKFIKYWDNPNAIFYVDPPYVLDTRSQSNRNTYSHEMTLEEHKSLTDLLLSCSGAVVLSGYRDGRVHEPLEQSGWKRVDFHVTCHAAGRVRGSGLKGKGTVSEKQKRVESVWINQKAMSLLPMEIRKSIDDAQPKSVESDGDAQLMLF